MYSSTGRLEGVVSHPQITLLECALVHNISHTSLLVQYEFKTARKKIGVVGKIDGDGWGRPP